MNPLQAVHTNQAPKAVGAYSQAIQHQGMLYTSGQIGLDPQSGNMVADDVSSQAKQVVANLSAVIEAAGGQLN
ncbi:MAG: Rid family hydrolase, partial [Ghiorsea sp.]|nr:Rid family hydrolase [Ghiorsea sp.]